MTIDTLTAADVTTLRNEAGVAGDSATVDLCDLYLTGSDPHDEAATVIAAIIDNSEAMADEYEPADWE